MVTGDLLSLARAGDGEAFLEAAQRATARADPARQGRLAAAVSWRPPRGCRRPGIRLRNHMHARA